MNRDVPRKIIINNPQPFPSEPKQPDNNEFVSLETEKISKRFIEEWILLAKLTGKGFVTVYMKDKQFSNIVVHKDITTI